MFGAFRILIDDSHVLIKDAMIFFSFTHYFTFKYLPFLEMFDLKRITRK